MDGVELERSGYDASRARLRELEGAYATAPIRGIEDFWLAIVTLPTHKPLLTA